ncbi:restriction endonuclease subunit S [Lutibacter sp. A80]|uniref:restriction endonuclease subunit S n=1 Tax=Lutibacter sp. A80 TaxID=2918453 RepID=UPI001F053461|nr:restriction endonuclease subunit S [Lutibacter sp. A80]UMB61032.1 restriction endonuclease subunit S [Lutibacter sp. A80]
MNSEFSIFKLGEVADIFAGGDKPKIFSVDKSNLNNIPVFANAEKKYGLQGYTDTPRIIDSAVTVAARGSNVGFVAIRKEPFFPIVRLLTLIPNSKLLDVDYLFYNLKQNRQGGTGSGQPQITIPQISDRIISLPSLITQQKIAKVLSDLDAKIEINNKINQELEAMAKTLYNYWFVQFDFPDANGKPYKSSGGLMVYNEELKREIPVGWEDGVLSDIANITMGQSPAGSSYNEEENGTVFYQGSTDFGLRFPTVRKYTTEPSRMAEENDILLSVRAPVGTLNQTMESCCIGRGLAALREKEGSNSFLWSQMEHFKQIFDRRNSSGTTFGSITKDDLFGLKLCFPNKDTLEKFKKIADPFHEKIIVNSKENQKLSKLRDWLLPMLMNGQVTVGEAALRQAQDMPLGMVAESGEGYKKE